MGWRKVSDFGDGWSQDNFSIDQSVEVHEQDGQYRLVLYRDANVCGAHVLPLKAEPKKDCWALESLPHNEFCEVWRDDNYGGDIRVIARALECEFDDPWPDSNPKETEEDIYSD